MGVFLLDDLQLALLCDDTDPPGGLSDETAFGNDAVESSTPEYELTGINDECIRLNFGGGTDHFTIPATADLQFGDESFTISLWTNQFNEAGGSGGLVCRWVGTTERSYILTYSQTPNTMLFGVSHDGSQANTVSVTSTNAPLTINGSRWYHTLAIHDAANDELRLHVTADNASNIRAADSVAHSLGVWDQNTNVIDIGRLQTAGPGYLHGTMDDIFVWRRALNAEEIEAMFQRTPFSSFVSDTGSDASASLQYFWRD